MATTAISYLIGELLMPCCDTPAVPKTSPLGLQFFAHASGECGGAPESIWHLRAKEEVANAARRLGHDAVIEVSGKGWRADVLIKTPNGAFVVECQHSYQHLRQYVARQKRYADLGYRCLWLVIEGAYQTLSLCCARYRQRTDLKGIKTWPMDQAGFILDFPVGLLQLDDYARVVGPGLNSELPLLLEAFTERRLAYEKGRWLIISVS